MHQSLKVRVFRIVPLVLRDPIKELITVLSAIYWTTKLFPK